MAACAVKVFGRPLADMRPADADCMRGHLAELDWCPACRAYRLRVAALAFDAGAARIAYDW